MSGDQHDIVRNVDVSYCHPLRKDYIRDYRCRGSWMKVTIALILGCTISSELIAEKWN